MAARIGSSKLLCSLTIIFHNLVVLEGFQWSPKQQSSHVTSVVLGSDVSLPCDYELTERERQEVNKFYLLTWSREEPFNSNSWAGLAIKSSLTGTQVIYEDPEHIFLRNDTLFVANASLKDHSLYQCSFHSSFFAPPSTLQLNVQYKPTETKLTSESEFVEEGKKLEITCTARANPAAEYRFYRDDNLIGPSKTGVHTLTGFKSKDEGTYKCVPYNALGDGPEASIAVTLKVISKEDDKFPVWAFGAIGGGALSLVLVASVVAVICSRKKKKIAKKANQAPSKASRQDAREAYVGPAIYGEQMNGGNSVPHLNGALSVSDLRVSRVIPSRLRGATSAADVRLSESNRAAIQDGYLTRSVINLVEDGAQSDSRL